MDFDVSIIIPVFNVEKFLPSCLESIYRIQGINKEIIIVNDGSTDGSYEIICTFKELFPSITKVISQENKGLSCARNAGMSCAIGKYIAFVDGDDIISPEQFSLNVREALSRRPDILFGEFQYFIESRGLYSTPSMRSRRKKLTNLFFCTGIDFWEKSLQGDSIRVEVCTNLFSTRFLREAKLSFKEKLIHEDTLFMFLASYFARKVYYCPTPFYQYRIRENSIMRSPTRNHGIHKLYICKVLLDFKRVNRIRLFSWDSLIISLYFDAVRRFKVKNSSIVCQFGFCTRLTIWALIKKLLLPLLELNATSVEAKV